MPPHDHDSQLHAVLSFYCSVVSVTPEGDSIVSEETLEGLGTDGFRSLFTTLFGSLLRVAFPFEIPRPSEPSSIPSPTQRALDDTSYSAETMATAAAGAYPTFEDSTANDLADSLSHHAGADTPGHTSTGVSRPHKKYRLTDFVPDPGYFVAGAIAGGVSRTATAPLDRLKVYLLVNTASSVDTAGVALKEGRPVAAAKKVGKPISGAVRELFRSGGLRSFFAGKYRLDRTIEAWHMKRDLLTNLGNGLNVVKIMPETAIKFGSYEAAKRALANFEGHGDPKKINSYSKFTAGGVAGMIAQYVFILDYKVPLD